MTQEEKARRYDKAFERAKDYFKANQKIGESEENDMLSDIFPELKESEDEKNIKNLIDGLKCSLRAANWQNEACNGGYEKKIALLEWAIAWLEKQGETFTKKDVDDAYLKGISDAKNELEKQGL